jgi:peptidyl-prolyl cis-trans isomerase C
LAANLVNEWAPGHKAVGGFTAPDSPLRGEFPLQCVQIAPYRTQDNQQRENAEFDAMEMAQKLKTGFVAASIACLLHFSGLPAEARVLAKVDGIEVTSEEFELALQDIGRTLPQQMPGPQRTAYILNYLIDLKLAAKRAENEQLQKSGNFDKKMAYFRQKAMMELYLDKIAGLASDDTKIKTAYDAAAKDQKTEPEVNAAHILVKTKAEAEAALKRVQGGEDFAKVAKEISKDPGSPGGELGWFTKSRMVPPFAEMAFKTEPGKISAPVQTRFG